MSIGVSKQFYQIKAGAHVTDGKQAYRVTHLISMETVLAVDLVTNQSHRLHIDSLRLVTTLGETAKATPEKNRDLSGFSEEEWKIGQMRFEAIKPLIENDRRVRADVEQIAKAHNTSVPSLYRWLRLFLDANHVSALVPNKKGRKDGTVALDHVTEQIIHDSIEKLYLTKQRHTPQEVIEDVVRICRLRKLKPPHANTVRNRLRLVPDKQFLRMRGRRDEAANLYTPIRGAFPDALQPFSTVLIDHTPANIIVVDEVHRKPMGKPYLTAAIDSHSRMIAGVYLSMEAPSATSVGLCLAQAMCSKREYLASLGVSGSWPVWGRMKTIHCDNAKEFRGQVLERACEEHDIDIAWRPVKKPQWGGIVERLMGTFSREFHKLPGTTFSNPQERKGYNSEAEAALTLKELERHLVDFIVNVYHQRVHSELGMSPLKKWRIGIEGSDDAAGVGMMPIPEDPQRILLDFMPFYERTIQPYGIQLDGISYFDAVLSPYVNSTVEGRGNVKRKFTVRRDPRDISRIYFLDPADNRYSEIPYKNIGHPPMSLWELNEVKKRLIESGRADVDEEAIFAALARMREMVEQSKAKSKAARRSAHRNPVSATVTGVPHIPTTNKSRSIPVEPAELADDPFSQPIEPFNNLSVFS